MYNRGMVRGIMLIALNIVFITIAHLPTGAAPASSPAATQPSTRQSGRRIHVIVSGRVQGVGFRAFTQSEARKLHLSGYVLNRDDGTVEAVIEGPSDTVDRLLELLKRGPDGARVRQAPHHRATISWRLQGF